MKKLLLFGALALSLNLTSQVDLKLNHVISVPAESFQLHSRSIQFENEYSGNNFLATNGEIIKTAGDDWGSSIEKNGVIYFLDESFNLVMNINNKDSILKSSEDGLNQFESGIAVDNEGNIACFKDNYSKITVFNDETWTDFEYLKVFNLERKNVIETDGFIHYDKLNNLWMFTDKGFVFKINLEGEGSFLDLNQEFSKELKKTVDPDLPIWLGSNIWESEDFINIRHLNSVIQIEKTKGDDFGDYGMNLFGVRKGYTSMFNVIQDDIYTYYIAEAGIQTLSGKKSKSFAYGSLEVNDGEVNFELSDDKVFMYGIGQLTQGKYIPFIPRKFETIYFAGTKGVEEIQSVLLTLVDGDFEVVESPIPSHSIVNINQDTKGRTWVSCISGLFMFEKEKWLKIDLGEQMADSEIYSVNFLNSSLIIESYNTQEQRMYLSVFSIK